MEEEQALSSDMEEVREQLEQQRVLAAQLREKLHQDEQQLASKELQNERLKSKLSLIKSRSRTKRESVLSEKDDRSPKADQELVSGSTKRTETEILSPLGGKRTPSKANKGKINILREQLEQNRLRFERHGQELTEDARSMEVMVEQLRHELEERDVTIQQLQAGQIPPASVAVEETVVEKLDLGAQLAQKEAQVLELINKASELQNTVLELQENLKEKDCVIEARTQAITLLSEDMSKKWRANVDMLEETRQQMHIMQENFIGIEAGLNAEIEQLNQHLESKSKKIAQLDQNYKDSEASRLDLAARNAELLDQISKLQDHQSRSGEKETQAKIEELTQALSEAKKVAVKLTAEHKAKVKMLNKQIDSLRKESGASEEVVRLQNHIAELEEEKGNLQLHLIEMEEKTGNQEQQLMELRSRLTELQDLKIAAEMKVVELEEQLSTGNFEHIIAELRMKLDDKDEEIKGLHDKLGEIHGKEKGEQEVLLSELQHELKEANGAVAEWQMRCESLEAELTKQKQEIEHFAQSLTYDSLSTATNSNECNSERADTAEHREKDELEELKLKLQEYENVLVPKIENLERAFLQKNLEVKELESLLHINVQKIETLSVNAMEQESTDKNRDEVTVQNLLVQREEQIAQLLSIKEKSEILFKDHCDLQAQYSFVLQERDSLIEQLNDERERFTKLQEATHQERDVSELQRELIEASGELDLKREECVRLETKLKAQAEKYKKMAVNLKVKTVANKDLEERIAKFESILASCRAQIEQLSKEKQDNFEKWQLEISEKESLLHQATDKLSLKDIEIGSLQKELNEKTALICDLETTLATTEKAGHGSQKLLGDAAPQVQSVDGNLEIEKKLEELQSQLSSETEEKVTALSRLETVTKNAKIKLAKEKKIRLELEQKLEELENLLSEKARTISEVSHQLETEIEKLKEEKCSMEAQVEEARNYAESLKQELESVKSLHFASENLIAAEQRIELTQELNVDTVEDIQAEIENLRFTWATNQCSLQEILDKLNDEKSKSFEDLRLSFDTVHKMISKSMSGKPDLEAEFRLFNELRSLVTKVTQRTSALEAEVKRIIGEKEEQVKQSIIESDRRIQALQDSLQEAKVQLDVVENEKVALQEQCNHQQSDYFNLKQTLLEEKQEFVCVQEKLQQGQEELREMKEKLDHEKQNKEELLRKLQFSEGELEKMRQKATILEQQLGEVMQVESIAKEELEGTKQRVLDLEHQLTLSKLEQDTLQKEFEEMRYEAQERQELCCSLQEAVDGMKQKCSALELQMEAAKQSVLSLEQQLQESKQQQNELKYEIQNLEGEAHKASQSEKNLLYQLRDMEERTLSLEAELEQRSEMSRENLEKLESCRNRIAELEQELEASSRKISTLESQLTESLQTYNDQYSTWAAQKIAAEKQISELTQQLVSARQEQENIFLTHTESAQSVSSSNSTVEDLLHQQLAEKTAEIENYQRRLIQLQMGGPDSSSSFFGVVSESGPVSEASEVLHLQNKVEELERLLQSQQSHQNLPTSQNAIMDVLQPASSMFEPHAEVAELQQKVASLSQQLTDLHRESDHLRQEQCVLNQLRADYEQLTHELHVAQSDARQALVDRQAVTDLNVKITEVTQELAAARNQIEQLEQEKCNTQELRDQIKELQSQLEATQTEKDTAEENKAALFEQLVKLQAKVKAIREKEIERSEDRPCIPQTLDTHVSTLDTDNPLSNMYKDTNSEGIVHGAMDESLMERNINQLESELSGMVTSQQERAEGKSAAGKKNSPDSWDVKCDGEVWGWVDNGAGNIDEDQDRQRGENEVLSSQSLEMLVRNLKKNLRELETEKNSALSQVRTLQDEIAKLKTSATDTEADQLSPVLTETIVGVDQNWGEGDDGWGWNSGSAKLEEQHLQLRQQEEQKSNESLEELHSKIIVLEGEKDDLYSKNIKLTEDLKASQLRAAKLVKKAKEFKQKYDDMAERKQSFDSPVDSLDQAIEEERAKQVQNLEKELKDLHVELNSIRLERDKLSKQVEVFSSANERMLEAKERQDVEVEMWQKRSKDLTNQLQALEWRIKELEEEKQVENPLHTSKQMSEHLPEKTAHSAEVLNPVEVEQLLKENHTWNANYETLMQEYQKLRAQCLADSEQRTQIDALVTQQKGIMERLEHEKKYLQDVYDSLKMDYEAANAQLALRQDTDKLTEQLSQEKADLEVELNTTQLKLQEVELQLCDALAENVDLKDQFRHLENTKRDLLSQMDQDEQNLSRKVEELTIANNRLAEQHRLLEDEVIILRNKADSSAQFESEVLLLRQQVSEMKQSSPEQKIQDVFEKREVSDSTSSPSSVLNWNAMVVDNTAGAPTDDVFDSIVNNNTHALEEQLHAKDTELQREKRMIETLKRTHEEAEQEWSQIIEHHKSQLEAAKNLVDELKEQLSVKCSQLSDQYALVQQSREQEEKENFQAHSLQGEITALKEHLGTTQSATHLLEEALQSKDHEIKKLQEQVQVLEMKASLQLEKSLSDGNSASSTPAAEAGAVQAVSSDESKVRSELDLALYRLHQRDVRIEELTLELMRLLEERDTLQLRLSNAIRMNEDLREKLKQLQSGEADVSTTTRSSPSSRHLSAASSTISLYDQHAPHAPASSALDKQVLPDANQVGLASKLAELHSVGYRKDKWLQEESELRHQQQMQLLTSPTATSNLIHQQQMHLFTSPTATTYLVPSLSPPSFSDQASSTSYVPVPALDGAHNESNIDSDANQSTSSDSQGLLNWIWGRR